MMRRTITKNYVAKLSDMGLGKQLRQRGQERWRHSWNRWMASAGSPCDADEEDDVEDRKQREENQVQQISSIVWVVLWMWSMGCVLHVSVFGSTSVRKVV